MFAINKTTSNAPPVAVAQPLYQQLPSDALHFGGFVPVSAGTPVGGRVHDALGIDEVTASLLHATDTYTIMQRPSLTEGLCPACERSNIYDVYDAVTGMHLFIAKERSDCVPRYCCAPYHSLFLELKGAAGLNPMLSHMVDVDTLGTVLTLERPGCMLPKPCLCCVACSDPCKDGMYLHAGALPADASAGGIRTTNRCIALSRSLALSLSRCFTRAARRRARSQASRAPPWWRSATRASGPRSRIDRRASGTRTCRPARSVP